MARAQSSFDSFGDILPMAVDLYQKKQARVREAARTEAANRLLATVNDPDASEQMRKEAYGKLLTEHRIQLPSSFLENKPDNIADVLGTMNVPDWLKTLNKSGVLDNQKALDMAIRMQPEKVALSRDQFQTLYDKKVLPEGIDDYDTYQAMYDMGQDLGKDAVTGSLKKAGGAGMSDLPIFMQKERALNDLLSDENGRSIPIDELGDRQRLILSSVYGLSEDDLRTAYGQQNVKPSFILSVKRDLEDGVKDPISTRGLSFGRWMLGQTAKSASDQRLDKQLWPRFDEQFNKTDGTAKIDYATKLARQYEVSFSLPLRLQGLFRDAVQFGYTAEDFTNMFEQAQQQGGVSDLSQRDLNLLIEALDKADGK